MQTAPCAFLFSRTQCALSCTLTAAGPGHDGRQRAVLVQVGGRHGRANDSGTPSLPVRPARIRVFEYMPCAHELAPIFSLCLASHARLLSFSRIDEPVLRAHVATVVEGAAGRQIDVQHGRELSRGQRAYNSTAMGGSSSAAPAAPRQPSKVL